MSPKLYDKLPWTQGLVLDLPLYLSQLGSGGKVLDRTRYHNNGIVTGATWSPQGRTFDGVDDVITIASNAALTTSVTESLLLWLNWDNTQPDSLGQIYTCGNDVHLYIEQPTGILTLEAYWGGSWRYGQSSSGWVINGVWALYGVTFEASNGNTRVRFYRNTTTGTSPTLTGQPLGTLVAVSIGSSVGRDYKGIIGDVIVATKTMNILEITNIYNQTLWRYV